MLNRAPLKQQCRLPVQISQRQPHQHVVEHRDFGAFDAVRDAAQAPYGPTTRSDMVVDRNCGILHAVNATGSARFWLRQEAKLARSDALEELALSHARGSSAAHS